MIQFVVPCCPVAQPRQRHAVRNGLAINYTESAHPVNAFKAAVQVAFREVYKDEPLDGPIDFVIVFVLPRPKKYFRKKDSDGRIWCTSTPDIDNLCKSAVDALKGMAWRDDAQICKSTQHKLYAGKNEQACVEVSIEMIQEIEG